MDNTKKDTKESERQRPSERQKQLVPLLDPEDIQILQRQLEKYETLKQCYNL